MYLLAFSSAAAQVPEGGAAPLERYGISGVFGGVIAVQYWENRKKDAQIQANAEKQAVQNERMITILEDLREETRARKPER